MSIHLHKTEYKTVSFTFRATPKQIKAIKALAEKNELSEGEVVRQLLDKALGIKE